MERFRDLIRPFSVFCREPFLFDAHTHTTWTDGNDSPEAMAAAAYAAGMTALAFTEHVRASSTFLSAYAAEIASLRACAPVRVFCGCEAKIAGFDGSLDIPDDADRFMDFVVASVHRMPLGRRLYTASDLGERLCNEIELELTIAAIRRGGFDVLGHAGGMSLATFGRFPEAGFDEIAAACREHGIVFEMNARYHAAVVDLLLDVVARHDPLVSWGSDAHGIEGLAAHARFMKECYVKD
jgi:histidinol phosphatase-like PHP family hydrolase